MRIEMGWFLPGAVDWFLRTDKIGQETKGWESYLSAVVMQCTSGIALLSSTA
jgi:hypothetical protein